MRIMVIKSVLLAACSLFTGCAPMAVQVDESALEREKQQVKIIKDRQAPAGMRGFLRLAQAYSITVRDLGGAGPDLRSLKFLIDACNDDTAIQTSFAPTVPYTDPRMMDLPVVVPQTRPEETDMEPLARYLMQGGFVLGITPGAPVHIQDYIQALERFGGLVLGQDMRVENLPDDHPVYHILYPLGGKPLDFSSPVRSPEEALALRGLFIKKRLVAVNCALPRLVDNTGQELEYSPQHLNMAVNIVLYALIQPGSLAQRISLGR